MDGSHMVSLFRIMVFVCLFVCMCTWRKCKTVGRILSVFTFQIFSVLLIPPVCLEKFVDCFDILYTIEYFPVWVLEKKFVLWAAMIFKIFDMVSVDGW